MNESALPSYGGNRNSNTSNVMNAQQIPNDPSIGDTPSDIQQNSLSLSTVGQSSDQTMTKKKEGFVFYSNTSIFHKINIQRLIFEQQLRLYHRRVLFKYEPLKMQYQEMATKMATIHVRPKYRGEKCVSLKHLHLPHKQHSEAHI